MVHPLISTKLGKLLGKVCQNWNGDIYYSFQGVPYATPPIGTLRFKAPLPPTPWNGILNATQNGNCCYSKDLFTKEFVGSEDCLNLNVYTPVLPETENQLKLKPIMVWIHGGGFTCGSNSSDIYGPEYLMTADVVVVTINYRLGLLGFLSLDDASLKVPGNAGFKDMIMALKWVQSNIEMFGGDPNNVTIFGESAGGAAVHLLMLSPMAKGLFHKAIAQSGCALNPWCRGRNFDKYTFHQIFGFKEDNYKNILKYMQTVPVKQLLDAQTKIDYYLDPNKIGPFGLVIENANNNGEDGFMPQEPLDIILSGNFANIPFIIGLTKMEGMVINTYKQERVLNMVHDFESNIPFFLGYKNGSQESKNLGQKIKTFYYGDEKPGDNNRHRFYNMVTDTLFLYGIYCTVKKHRMLSSLPIYLYRMSIDTSLKFLKAVTSVEEPGAAHADDVACLFKSTFTPSFSPDSIEHATVKKFVTLWTNFAYTGNPTPAENEFIWDEVKSSQQICFLDINKELACYDSILSVYEALKFWDEIYFKSPSGSKFV